MSEPHRMRDRYKDISRVSKRWQFSVTQGGYTSHSTVLQTLEGIKSVIAIRLMYAESSYRDNPVSFDITRLSDTELTAYYNDRPIKMRKKQEVQT